MNVFNREGKLFTDQSTPQNTSVVTPTITPPFEMAKKPPTAEETSQKNQDPKQGILIFTCQASLFNDEELSHFFAQISHLINAEKNYGLQKTPETIAIQYEQELSVIGVSDYQVWGHACLYPIDTGIHVLEVAIRDDFRSTEAAKQLVNLFVRHNTHQQKEIYALSWTPYTKRLFRELTLVQRPPEAIDPKHLDALRAYDEFIEQYDIFVRRGG